jgi:cytochrome c oxidase cbb3-type subunit 2
MGENAQWIDPKPRDFTAAVFKCRSTPTGTLPTDEDLYHSVTRGFVTTNMPSWEPLTRQTRVNLVAYIKSFSSRWKSQGAGTPISVPAETPADMESILRGRQLFQKMECWKCHGPAGHGDGPSASTLTDSKDNPIRPYNFSAGTRFKCGDTNADLYRIFMTGVDGTPMPSFADNIQPQDAWDLVHFLRTLQPALSPEAMAWHAWLPSHGTELKPIGPDGGSQ